MNYKKLFKTQKTRFFILQLLRWVPAPLMVGLQYFIKLNRWPNLKSPKRFTEKMQHYKLHYRNPDMITCVDKHLVRDFVAHRGCEKYLNELYGVYDQGEEINFDTLPKQFVIKTTDGGGGDNIIICRDKSQLDIPRVIEQVNTWKNKKIGSMVHEWAYQGIKAPRIIVERYLEDPANKDQSINDYKFFCFDGRVEYLVADIDRYSGHKRNFYDKHWSLLNVSSDCPVADRDISKPQGFEEMIQLAEKLSHGFPFVRVDLYCIQTLVLFGEMTFYPWSGYVQFTPDSFDVELGKVFSID